ncbi:DUF397 domain-containing protein [Streptomyces sp. CRN 30]|uniref:DUF397 domain-containing protein n=1 Tax=Streptomyces sp. CRN 30 TaxID=3075613 RepID=UPI002A81B37C|nr:DUF397 domain-containing protein [Streptomyces sp. CRN 30]
MTLTTSAAATALEWIKSSYSTSDGPDCVEVAALQQVGVLVRDSKDPLRGHLTLTPATWAAFLPHAST